ncbi:golgin subfamily A member 1 [Hetaerina americana]|uniref:golgin subfamily A member 1 n=1 Tax=Hetaerina americana TaxID=62018 RepID=UPI003A7F5412
MFANLKNKIREETGSDVAKLAPILNSPPNQQSRVIGVGSNRHSNHGSTSSLSSFTEADGTKEDTQSDGKGSYSSGRVGVVGRGDRRVEEEWARILERRDAEWRRKLEDQEAENAAKLEESAEEWRRTLELLTSEKAVLEEEKRDVVRQKLALEEALKDAREYKKKAIQYQEDMDQLEGFQTQEMSKIKHLLLVKEQELEEKSQQLKESESKCDSLRSELRSHAQQLNNLQDELEALRHSNEQKRGELSSDLQRSEEEVRHLRSRVLLLEERIREEERNLLLQTENGGDIGSGEELSISSKTAGLLAERARLERALEEAHEHVSEVKASWSRRIASLETQVERLGLQAGEEGSERRKAESERDHALQCAEEAEARASLVNKLEKRLAEAEALISDKECQLKELKDHLADAEEKSLEMERKAESLQGKSEELKQLLTKSEEEIVRERGDRGALERALEVERSRGEELCRRLQGEVERRESLELRVAAVRQEGELAARRERERKEEVEDEVRRVGEALRLVQAELDLRRAEVEEMVKKTHELEGRLKDQVHHPSIFELEAQLTEKNKSIRVLQQRLGDMKKTLQRELRNTTGQVEGGAVLAVPESESLVGGNTTFPPTPIIDVCTEGGKMMQKESSGKSPRPPNQTRVPQALSSSLEDDVNFQYLKHVVVKFLTSKEYEAQQLTRAVSTLLRLNPEEERLLRETLQWRASWFGSAGWRFGLSRASPSGTNQPSPT